MSSKLTEFLSIRTNNQKNDERSSFDLALCDPVTHSLALNTLNSLFNIFHRDLHNICVSFTSDYYYEILLSSKNIDISTDNSSHALYVYAQVRIECLHVYYLFPNTVGNPHTWWFTPPHHTWGFTQH